MKVNETVWRTIDENQRYEVSNVGDVRNRYTGKMLSYFVDKDGYYIFHLCSNGKQHNRRAHRLVAEAFLEHSPDQDRNQINHKNNRLDIIRMRSDGMMLKDIASYYGVGISTIHTICKGGV